MDILTNERLLSPTSPDVTSPHGTDVDKNERHDMALTVSPPKYLGKSEQRDQLKTHCNRKCILVNNRGQGKAKWPLPKTILL
jgi:hypothetical protein